MENSIFVGLSRQIALQSNMDIVANNIANMSTPGYRAQNMVFTEFVNNVPNSPKTPPRDPLSMVLDYGQYQNSSPGPLKKTGNALDVALHGGGYFGVQTPDGEVMYTRAGNFQINNLGELVTGSGQRIADTGGGTITIPDEAKEIKISEEGFVSTEEGTIGQLMITEFENIQDLEAMGNGLYKAKTEGTEATNTRAIQGMLEGSNVNPVIEMTRMIEVHRAYQSTQKFLQTEHDRQKTMIQRLTRS